jgi:tetratricopeptide (TPR) repeat protein
VNRGAHRPFIGMGFLLALTTATLAQTVMNAATPFDPVAFGTVTVYLRTEDGQPLPQKLTPIITIGRVEGGAASSIVPQQLGDGWTFSGVGIGNDYKVQVVATGYTPAQEQVYMPNTPGASASVIVFLHPIDQELVFHRPTGQFVLPPRAGKEIQHAFGDLQSGKLASAQKHTQRGIALAPENPYAQYVMGLTYLFADQWKQAKPYLEKSVSTDPRQPLALAALGTARYRLGDDAGAVEVLSKAVQLDASSWKTEWLLAASYLGEKQYGQAREHAEQAIKVGKQQAGQVRLVLGQALAGLGEREAAAQTFEAFAAQYPKDPNAAQVLQWAKLMREPPKLVPVKAGVGPNALVPVPAVEVSPRVDWAPPDVDAVQPFVVSTLTCPLDQILKAAGTNAEQLVTTLQQFSAKEDFQSIEIKRGGQLERPDELAFNYMVFIDQISPLAFDVKEFRNQGNKGAAEAQLPGTVSDTGVPAMALAFHPVIQPDLEWKCEGLGTWKDQPAWVVHFQQRPDRPNSLALFSTPMQSYSLPLKGRAWVSERGGQVIHLDTDLVKPIEPLNLKREHFSIDYKQVSFRTQKVDLWLPENVDTYFQYRGHFLHYYHHFSDFKLFWVGATQKISDPKNKEPQE